MEDRNGPEAAKPRAFVDVSVREAQIREQRLADLGRIREDGKAMWQLLEDWSWPPLPSIVRGAHVSEAERALKQAALAADRALLELEQRAGTGYDEHGRPIDDPVFDAAYDQNRRLSKGYAVDAESCARTIDAANRALRTMNEAAEWTKKRAAAG